MEIKNSGINFGVNRRRNCVRRICQKEVEILQHLATNCTEGMRNNKRMKKKRKGRENQLNEESSKVKTRE